MPDSRPVPRWLPPLLKVHGAWSALHRAEQRAVGEWIVRCVPVEARDAVTAWVYSGSSGYRPGEGTFDEGLREWEQRALDSDWFPRGGRVLVGGAGGGREMVALARRGWEVSAFEPSGLVSAAVDAARAFPAVRVQRASYRDLVLGVVTRAGPLAEWAAGPPFDAVVLGWTSITHVTDARERGDLLRALARVCPAGPVLVSYFAAGGADGVRTRWLTAALDRLLPPREPGIGFVPHGGFTHAFTDGEWHDLAREGGYRVAYRSREPCGHAILVPGA